MLLNISSNKNKRYEMKTSISTLNFTFILLSIILFPIILCAPNFPRFDYQTYKLIHLSILIPIFMFSVAVLWKNLFPFRYIYFVPLGFSLFLSGLLLPPIAAVIYGIVGWFLLLMLKFLFEKLIVLYQLKRG
jgi:hypothetical protein